MKAAFRKALWLYKYAAILFTIVYWIYIVIDDYVLVKKYVFTDWLTIFPTLAIWLVYYLIYFIGFSLYFWALATVIIFVYHRLIKRFCKTAY